MSLCVPPPLAVMRTSCPAVTFEPDALLLVCVVLLLLLLVPRLKLTVKPPTLSAALVSRLVVWPLASVPVLI